MPVNLSRKTSLQRQLLPLLTISCLALLIGKAASENTWIEAERALSYPNDVKVIRSKTALLTQESIDSARSVIAKSGWSMEAGMEVSGGAYVQMSPEIFDSTSVINYEFSVPKEGTYYIWLRCNAPPPCWRSFNVWLDTPQNREKKKTLNFGFDSVWTWWPWGEVSNTGHARAYHLKAGKHTLFVGDMSHGLMLDKILITDDYDYVPYGTRESYFTSSFEPPKVVDYHRQQETTTKVRATATGWLRPTGSPWHIFEERTGNHYYYCDLVDPASQGIAYSIVTGLHCGYFKADMKAILAKSDSAKPKNAMFVFAFLSSNDYWAVMLEDKQAKIINCIGGKMEVLDTRPVPKEYAASTIVPLSVSRNWTNLTVRIGASVVFDRRIRGAMVGGIGVASTTGAIGFDDVRIFPKDDIPSFSFDLSDHSDPCLADWVLAGKAKGGRSLLSNNTKPSDNGMWYYRVQPFTNASIRICLKKQDLPISLLFPFRDQKNWLGTRITMSELQFCQCSFGKEKLLASLPTPATNSAEVTVTMQLSQGTCRIYYDRDKVFERNEYEQSQGTIAIIPEKALSVARINMRCEPHRMLQDGFVCSEDALNRPVSNPWSVYDGVWRINGKQGTDDGVLCGTEPGRVLIGSTSSSVYRAEISLLVDEDTEAGLIGWFQNEFSIGLLCRSKSLSLCRIKLKDSLPLSEARFQEPLSGWHRLGMAFDRDGIRAFLDEKEIMHYRMPQCAGYAGIWNNGKFAVLDDFRMDVQEEIDRLDAVTNDDVAFQDIERSLSAESLSLIRQ